MGFLKKLKKAVKKAFKQAVHIQGLVNPLVPGGAANHLITQAGTTALPVIAGLALGGAGPALGLGAGSALGSAGDAPGGFLGTINDIGNTIGGVFHDVQTVAGTVGGVLGQAGNLLDQLSPDHHHADTPGYQPGAPTGVATVERAPSSSNTLKYVLIGGAVLGAVVLLKGRR